MHTMHSMTSLRLMAYFCLLALCIANADCTPGGNGYTRKHNTHAFSQHLCDIFKNYTMLPTPMTPIMPVHASQRTPANSPNASRALHLKLKRERPFRISTLLSSARRQNPPEQNEETPKKKCLDELTNDWPMF